jgi:hypothetical protein
MLVTVFHNFNHITMATKKAAKAIVTAPIEAVVVKKVENFSLKLGIDQVGADIENPLTDRMYFQLEVSKEEGKALNLRKIAGQFANMVWSWTKGIKGRNKGFNVTFFVDNNLVESVSMKGGGKIHFSNAASLAGDLWRNLCSQFDLEASEGLLTGEVEHTEEVRMAAKQLGLQSQNLPFSYMEPLFEINRKVIAKKFSAAQKDAIAHFAPEYAAQKKIAADKARAKAEAKKALLTTTAN